MKNLENLGKVLTKQEQKSINGGTMAIHKCGGRCIPGSEGCKQCAIDGSWRKQFTIPSNGKQ